MDLAMHACWREEDVTAIISNEALEGHEGVFLATHSPITGFAISGSHAGDILGNDQQAALTALSDPIRRHAFCVVQGEPGSGKSHLIRWLSVNWPQNQDVKLLLQRADGSLDGALRQLRARLPLEFQDLFDKLGRVHRATEKGRANLFLANLASALDPDHFDPPLEDVDWCRANLPGELVGHLDVKRSWLGPSRILRLMDGKGSSTDDKRNSETATFNLFDIEDLAYCCASLRGTGVRPAAEKLAIRLVEEAIVISEYRSKGWSAEEIEREGPQQLQRSTQLMKALNKRRNDAIQNVLGVSAEGLKSLFRQVRQELAARGQRLVLLLEDITSWEGIDDSLIDVLVTNAETRGAESDLCPLISVVGITPAYYQRLPGNYRGRITHELSLGEAKPGELQDVATLRASADRISFAARYLAAVRTGEVSLGRWRERRRVEDRLPPPNKCDDCPARQGCHRAFGAYDGIGLFPFTSEALERFYVALNDHDNGLTWKTPRGILQAILSPNLLQPWALQDGHFPTHLLETKALGEDSGQLSPRLSRMLEAKIEEEDDRNRMRRVLAYWGDRERADTTRLQNGDLAFASVPQGVFVAFQLPWIGEDAITPTAEPRLPDPTVPPEPPSVVEPKLDSPPSPPRVGRTVVRSRPQVPDPPSRPRPTKSELERLRAQLRRWTDGAELEDPSKWNKTLYDLVLSIDARRIGLDPYTFHRIMTPERVKIEGTGPAQRNYFGVRPEKWVRDGFEGYLALRLDSKMSGDDAEFHQRNLALMMRHLERLAREYADRRLSVIAGGERWSPISSLTQTLLARAWLRGATFADDPPATQLRVLLSDESEAESDPIARCAPWREFLDQTKDWHDRFRTALRDMLGTPQGESRGFGLADLSLVAGAIQRLCATLRFDPVPAADVDTGVAEFDKVRHLITACDGSLSRLVRTERDEIRQRAEVLRPLLRGRAVRDHFLRVDLAIETVVQQLANASPDQVRKWKSSYDQVKPRLETGSDQRVEMLLMSFSEADEAQSNQNSGLLTWLSRAPARDLDEVRSLALLGEQVVSSILEHVVDLVSEAGHSASLGDIHKIGKKLRAAIHPASISVGNAA